MNGIAESSGDMHDRVSADIAGQSGSNFYYAFFFLPPARRRALNAVYAYCRIVDDIVDGDDSVETKAAALKMWRAELEAAFSGGQPTHPVALGLKEGKERFGLRYSDALAILEGCEMDLHKSRYATWEELYTYCYHVASAVGLLCIALFGCIDPRSRDYAIHLGRALQLTNILRDIREDSLRDRVYVPTECLEAHGISETELFADPLRGSALAGVRSVVSELATRARAEYSSARSALTAADRRALLPAEIMGNVYAALLLELERRGPAVLSPSARIKLSPRKKLAVALSTLGQNLLPFPLAQRLVRA